MRTPILFRAVLCATGALAPAFAAVCFEPAVAHAATPTAGAIAASVDAFYTTTRSYRATFTQTYTARIQNVKQVSTGTVSFEKPGKMSFRYDPPNGSRIVADGTTLKMYQPDSQQMIVTSVGKSQYPAALAFLMGSGSLSRDFDLRLLDVSFPGGYAIEATPKAATPAYEKMVLYVDAQTSQVRRALILDAQGNRNRFDFAAPVVNQPAASGEFVFTPPPGTKVIQG